MAKAPKTATSLRATARAKGVKAAPPPSIAPEGATLIAAEMAVAGSPSDLVMAAHADILPSANNPRQAFDAEELALLADSICAMGLLQNLVVRPAIQPGSYILVAGERRWRAIGLLIKDGRWGRDYPIRCRLVEHLSNQDHAVLALIENLVRADLKPLEEARAFKALKEEHGMATDDIAGRINRTQRLVQQRLQLLDLSEADQKRLDSGLMTIEQARQRLANRTPPVVLSDAARLLLAELRHKIEHDPMADEHGCTEIQRIEGTDPALAELRDNSLTYGVYECYADGVRSGRLKITLSGWRFNDLDLSDLPEVSTPYATAWLNGPFVVPAEILARVGDELEARAADIRQRNEATSRHAEWLADRRAMVETLRVRPPALPPNDHVAEILTEVESPLPWSVNPRHLCQILDATGKEVGNFGWGAGAEMKARLVVIAVNAAAGLATPDAPVETEEDTETYEEEVGGVVDPDEDPEEEGGDPDIPSFLRRLAGGAE